MALLIAPSALITQYADRSPIALMTGQGISEEDRRRHLMVSAAHYAKLLQGAEGVLGEGHALLLQARSRLAHVMTLSRVPRSCANALPLWRVVIEQTRKCVPPNWPHLLPPLRGARDAAWYAGDEAASKTFSEALEAMLAVLRPSCDDVDGSVATS